MGAELRLLIDDTAIDDDVILYRRVTWDQIGGRAEHEPGTTPAISANFFTDRPASVAKDFGFAGPCMSIGLAPVMGQLNLDVEAILRSELLNGRDPSEFGVVSICVSDLRQLQKGDKTPRPQGVMAAPTAQEPWHGVVFDLTDEERAKPTRRAIAKIASWVIPLIA
jgi:hypothetical protein